MNQILSAKKLVVCLGVLCLLAVIASACGSATTNSTNDSLDTRSSDTNPESTTTSDTTPDEPTLKVPTLKIIATTSIWADVMEQLSCGLAEVSYLIPNGADPHGYAPSPRDVIAIREANLVVANGGGLESQLENTLDSAKQLFYISDLAPDSDTDNLEDEEEHEEHGEEEHDHEGDPHYWLDISLTSKVVETITPVLTQQLTQVLPEELTEQQLQQNVSQLEDCADQYLQTLEETDNFIRQTLQSVPQDSRLLVTQHNVLERFAERYGFMIVDSLIPSTSTLAESSVRHIIELQEKIRELGVATIFVDASGDPAVVDDFADNLGIQAVVLFTESLGEDDLGTYTSTMRENALQIAQALS